MLSIAPQVALATARTVSHLGTVAAASAAGPAAGGLVLVAMVVIGLFLTAVASAARGLATVLAQFVRLASAMTSAVILMFVVVLTAVALLIH